MEFEDFELLVQKKDSDYNVSVTKSPAGRAEAEFSLSEEDLQKIKTLLGLILADRSDENVNESFSRESGSILFDKLFSGNVKNRFHESLGSTQAEGKGLRIKLTLQEELQFIPWEFMYDEEKQLFLSRSSATVLARVPEAPQPHRKLSVNPPLKILVAISHPLSLLGTDDEFDVEKQRRVIEMALKSLVGEKKIYYEFLDIVNVNTLSEKLRKQFDVLHFIGHGTIGGLLIEDDDGNTYNITSPKFAELIEGKGLNLVLLESCCSSAGKEFTGVAQKLLLMGVPAVVAMQYPILVKSASIFFSEFYKCVAAGFAVDEAVSEARKIVYASPGQNCLDWATPTLYMNAPDGVLFSLGEVRSLPERHDVVELYTAPHFVGRREEMWTLKKALSSDKRVVLIEGFAGIGKSVLMNRVIQDVRPDFKGVFAVRCDEGYTLDLLFDRLNDFFLEHNESALNVGLPAQEKIPLLLNVLQAHKYVIVLDSFENVLENGVKRDFEALLTSFLSQPHQSKMVVTTRRSFTVLGEISGSVEHVVLGGLSPIHSVWLMERLGMRVSREDMGRIYEKTGGHPYAIEFVKELLRKEPLEQILELPMSGENILQLLYEVVETLAPGELSVLEQISVLRKPVHREALDFLVRKNKGWIEGLLDKHLLLYDERTELYYVHALVKEYAYAKLEDKRGAHVRAAKYYEEMVEVTRNIWDDVEAWYHNYEGEEYEKAGKIAARMTESLLKWERWELLRELLEKTVGITTGSLRAASLHNLGVACRYLGEYRRALECCEESLGLFREAGNKRNAAMSLNQIGSICSLRGDYEEALKKYGESLKIREELKDKKGYASTLHNIGMIYQDRGDYEEALDSYVECLKIFGELKDGNGFASTLHNIGNIYFLRGDYEKALEEYGKSLKIKEELNDTSGKATTLHQIGNIHCCRGDYEEALEKFEESLEIFEELKDKKGIAESLHNIGIIYQDRGDYEEALKKYEESLEIFWEIGDKNDIATSLHQIGIIHHMRGDYEKALDNYEESLRIREELKDKKGYASTLGQVGMIHHIRGDHEEALEKFEESLAIFGEIGDKKGIAISLHQIGMIHHMRGDYEKALDNYEESLKIREELKDKKGIAESFHQIGIIKILQGWRKHALKNFLISHAIFDALGVSEKKIVEQTLNEFIQDVGQKEFEELSREVEPEVKKELERFRI